MSDLKRLRIAMSMIVLKILYMLSVTLLLPEKWLIFSFDKNINWDFLLIEFIPLFIAVAIYAHWYASGSDFCFFSTLLFMMAFIPANSTLSLCGYDMWFYVQQNVFFIVLFSVLAVLIQKEKKKRKNENKMRLDVALIYQNKRQIWVIRSIMFIVCGIMIIYTYMYNGINFSILFSSMYDTRADYAAYVADQGGTLLSYALLFINGATYWLLPVYLFFSIVNKKLFDVMLCIFTYLCMYLLEMQKSTLVFILVIFFIAWFVISKKHHKVCDALIKAFVLLFIAVFLEYLIRGKSEIFSLVIRRMFYVPVYMTEKFYAYFSETNKFWLTRDAFIFEDILGRLINVGHSNNAVKTISQFAFQGLIPSPNSGLFAEAYLQMGTLGVFVFPFIIGLFAKVLRKISQWFGDGVSLVIMARLALCLLNTQILTTGRMIGVITFAMLTWFMKYMYSHRYRNTLSRF